MGNIAKYVSNIVIQDPDTGGDVGITIFKHENGGMFGVDFSYLDQVVMENYLGNEIINDPLSDVDEFSPTVILIYPKDE